MEETAHRDKGCPKHVVFDLKVRNRHCFDVASLATHVDHPVKVIQYLDSTSKFTSLSK